MTEPVVEVPSFAPRSPSKKSLGRKVGVGLKKKPKALKRRVAVSSKKKKKPKGVSKLMKELDAVFSRYVRLKNADSEGMVTCYTCGYRAHYKKMQNGHYLSRFYKKYRFDERNCRVQCSMCNMWKSGDIATFRMKLVAEIGAAEVESMEADYKELYKLTVGSLEGNLARYKALVEKLEQKDSGMLDLK